MGFETPSGFLLGGFCWMTQFRGTKNIPTTSLEHVHLVIYIVFSILVLKLIVQIKFILLMNCEQQICLSQFFSIFKITLLTHAAAAETTDFVIQYFSFEKVSF